MEEKQKIFIKGHKGRGDEVIDILTGLGAINTVSRYNDNGDYIYFINHRNEISCALIGSEIGAIVMDNYREIELPKQQWNDGDVLVFNGYPDCYAVFKKYNGDDTFKAYLLIDKNNAYFDVTASVEPYHLASKEERKKVKKKYYSMFQSLIAVE